MACTSPTTTTPTQTSAQSASPYVSYFFKPMCSLDENNPHLVDLPCSIVSGCPQDRLPGYLYGVLARGTWVQLQFQCRPLTGSPVLTPEQVAAAFVRLPLPRLRSHAQPAGKTLVNLDTIFFVEAAPLRRRVTLLGQSLELAIRPTGFTWIFGDGQVLTTRSAGAPYPSRAVAHRYEHVGSYRHHVTISWTAQWRLPGGTWQPVPGTATTAGPTSALRVVEAVPHLAGNG